MVELFGLYILCRNIGRILRGKGIRAGRYQALAVVLWFGFEFVAIQLLGAAGVPMTAGTYVLALVAGMASIPVSFGIARAARPAYRAPAGVGRGESAAGR